MSTSLPLLAGSLSTAIFIASTLPMLVKAGRTKDLASYSLGNIVLANIGNMIYAVYVFSLPFGPVWALHGFHLGATGVMLFWYLRHARRRKPRTNNLVGQRVAARTLPETERNRGPLEASAQTATSMNSR